MEAKEVFARNLSNLLQSADKTQAELAAYVHVAPPTITDWKKGRKMPRMDRIEKIAKFFHVSTDLLLGNERDRTQNGGPAHATAREMRQLEKVLTEPGLTYNGVVLTDDDRQKISKALELAFWDAKEKNKRK